MKLKRFTVDDVLAFNPCWDKRTVRDHFRRAGVESVTVKDIIKKMVRLIPNQEVSRSCSDTTYFRWDDYRWLLNRMLSSDENSRRYVGVTWVHSEAGPDYLPKLLKRKASKHG